MNKDCSPPVATEASSVASTEKKLVALLNFLLSEDAASLIPSRSNATCARCRTESCDAVLEGHRFGKDEDANNTISLTLEGLQTTSRASPFELGYSRHSDSKFVDTLWDVNDDPSVVVPSSLMDDDLLFSEECPATSGLNNNNNNKIPDGSATIPEDLRGTDRLCSLGESRQPTEGVIQSVVDYPYYLSAGNTGNNVYSSVVSQEVHSTSIGHLLSSSASTASSASSRCCWLGYPTHNEEIGSTGSLIMNQLSSTVDQQQSNNNSPRLVVIHGNNDSSAAQMTRSSENKRPPDSPHGSILEVMTPTTADSGASSPEDSTKDLKKKNNLGSSEKDSNSVANYTTVMLRNIPNKYTRSMLLEVIDEKFCGLYDFFYLPIDFRNKCNVGYAFLNFIHTHYAHLFIEEFEGYKLDAFKSRKVCQVSWGRVQGLQANIEHYRNSAVMSVSDAQHKPILFRNGVVVPFPGADGPLPQVKLRPQKG